MESRTYCFACYTMPWTGIELGIDVGNNSIEIPVVLTKDDFESLVAMMHWAWDNNWFEKSTSETISTQLIQKHNFQLYERIHTQVHQKFCNKYSDSEKINGFGVYEILVPDEVVEYASRRYGEKS